PGIRARRHRVRGARGLCRALRRFCCTIETEETKLKIDGRCHCGRISFSAEVDPERVAVCHCTDCQTLSGSPFRVAVPAPIEHFELRGEPKRYVKIAQSGNRRVQAFCPEC